MFEENQFMNGQQYQQPQTQDIAIQTQRPPYINNTINQQNPSSTPKNQQSQSQKDEQYDKVDITNIIPKVSNRQRLIQQNIKLKTQIYNLASQIDSIKQTKPNKQKQQDPVVKSKRLELKKNQIILMQIRNKTFNIKQEIESYDILNINNIENKIKNVKLEIEQNQEQKKSLKSISKGQISAMETEIPKQIQNKISQNKDKINQLREQYNALHTQILDNQRKIRKQHEQVIIKSFKIKEKQAKIALKQKQKQKQKHRQRQRQKQGQFQKQKSHKRSKSTYNNPPKISAQTINKLSQQIEQMQKQKKQGDKVWINKIRVVESEIVNKKQEQQKKILILKEKQKQYKLFELKLKQLNRFLKPVEVKKDIVDTSQFKFKRNIRYIQK